MPRNSSRTLNQISLLYDHRSVARIQIRSCPRIRHDRRPFRKSDDSAPRGSTPSGDLPNLGLPPFHRPAKANSLRIRRGEFLERPETPFGGIPSSQQVVTRTMRQSRVSRHFGPAVANFDPITAFPVDFARIVVPIRQNRYPRSSSRQRPSTGRASAGERVAERPHSPPRAAKLTSMKQTELFPEPPRAGKSPPTRIASSRGSC